MSQGGHSKPLLLLALSYQNTRVVGGPCNFSVSPSPFGLDFETGTLDFGLGLDNSRQMVMTLELLKVFLEVVLKVPQKSQLFQT